jgi:hypothetical protein
MRHGFSRAWRREAVMSFREKHLWISIVSTLGIWGWYYWRLIGSVANGGLADPRFAFMMGGLFIGCLVLVSILEIALNIFAAVTTRKAEREARDEREMTAALKASHVSLMALIGLVFSLAIAAYLLGFADAAANGRGPSPATDANALVLVANILLATVIVSELIRHVFTLGLLRRLR